MAFMSETKPVEPPTWDIRGMCNNKNADHWSCLHFISSHHFFCYVHCCTGRTSESSSTPVFRHAMSGQVIGAPPPSIMASWTYCCKHWRGKKDNRALDWMFNQTGRTVICSPAAFLSETSAGAQRATMLLRTKWKEDVGLNRAAEMSQIESFLTSAHRVKSHVLPKPWHWVRQEKLWKHCS